MTPATAIDLQKIEFPELFLETVDYANSGEVFRLDRNADLDMLKTNPLPDNMYRYYEGEYISHTDSRKTLMHKIYQLVKRYMMSRKLKMIEPYLNKDERLLDVGAGSGDWIGYAQSRSWLCEGIEPNPDARKKAELKGVNLIASFEELKENRYDLVTMWHVLEHLPDPTATIKKLKQLLDDDGLLVVAMPNFRSLDAEHYGKFWAALDVPRHIWHFSRRSVHHLFKTHGFEVIKEQPLIFDAFYVSLLSEKFKHGKPRPIAGLWNGLRSNLSASRTGEYSSVVYLLRSERRKA
ncbi:class I SAM-dependent methyltransferase [Zeaxanthinibacter enoshimensis]|uniref:class I SAM-dependent methyltransferase n=1 Tax=Zeaxanthinibacter enoshimensis TaxID=392009 RepID=UPI003562E9EC